MNCCVQCGSPIPDDQEVCSMCHGDIDHGADGYYRQLAEMERRRSMEDAEWEREMEEKERKGETSSESNSLE